MARSTKRRSCDGKVRYADKAAADQALSAIARRTGTFWGGSRSYLCRHCGCWHFGHKPRYRGQH